jgi:hypothetical protein
MLLSNLSSRRVRRNYTAVYCTILRQLCQAFFDGFAAFERRKRAAACRGSFGWTLLKDQHNGLTVGKGLILDGGKRLALALLLVVSDPVLTVSGNEITDPGELYSGCYGRAAINFYAYSRNGKKGISAGLLSVQKLHDGDALGGARGSADDFDDDYNAGEADDFMS